VTFRAAATDEPDVRDHLIANYEGGGLDWLFETHKGMWRWPHGVSSHAGYRRWLIDRLRETELFYVTAAMTAVVRQASLSYPRYSLHPDDLPADVGFVVFADAVSDTLTPDTHIPVKVRAALWSTCIVDLGSVRTAGVHVVVLNDADEIFDSEAFRTVQGARGRTAAEVRQVAAAIRRKSGPLAYHDELPLPFTYADEPYDPMRNTAIGSIVNTWLLMTQPLAETEDEPLPRAVRKRYDRARRPEPRVRTVALRQPRKHGGERDESAPHREYHHRWIVRGHWRNQWYPSLQRHRPVYIPSHVKGPEDAPLIGGERVNVLRR